MHNREGLSCSRNGNNDNFCKYSNDHLCRCSDMMQAEDGKLQTHVVDCL